MQIWAKWAKTVFTMDPLFYRDFSNLLNKSEIQSDPRGRKMGEIPSKLCRNYTYVQYLLAVFGKKLAMPKNVQAWLKSLYY